MTAPVAVDVLEQALHDPENQPSQFGTVPTAYLSHAENLIAGLLWQFDHAGCTCTFPDEKCCPYSRATQYMAERSRGILQAPGDES